LRVDCGKPVAVTASLIKKDRAAAECLLAAPGVRRQRVCIEEINGPDGIIN